MRKIISIVAGITFLISIILILVMTQQTAFMEQSFSKDFRQNIGKVSKEGCGDKVMAFGKGKDDIFSSNAYINDVHVESEIFGKTRILESCDYLNAPYDSCTLLGVDDYSCPIWECPKEVTSCNSKANACSSSEYDDCKVAVAYNTGRCAKSEWKDCECKRILSDTLKTNYSGSNTVKVEDCFSKHKIFLNDEIIFESELLSDEFDYKIGDLTIRLHDKDYYYDDYCYRIENEFFYDFGNERIKLNITEIFNDNDLLKVKVSVLDLMEDFDYVLILHYSGIVNLFGEDSLIERDIRKNITDNGEYVFEIEPGKISNIKFEPRINVEIKSISGLNYDCDNRTVKYSDNEGCYNNRNEHDSSYEPAESCQEIIVASYSGKEIEYEINSDSIKPWQKISILIYVVIGALILFLIIFFFKKRK